ncbi:hypothetical protein [Streptomyces sp. NPDC085466]|uniref:hypothetical protein n=1 Tax=Streptomyces sp. NPDC085466 TaxID=3365725 RepID=UPI0037D65E99
MAATVFGGLATLIGPLSKDDDDKTSASSSPSQVTAQPSQPASTAPAPSSDAPQQPAYQEVYSGRMFKLRTPRSSDCLTSFVDFDGAKAATGEDITPDEAELALQRCFEFGLWINATSASVAPTPVSSAEQCLELARQGGLVSVSGYPELKKEDPIKRGNTVCFETDAGMIVRAVAEEVRWAPDRHHDWVVDYTFKATAWQM